MLEKGNILAGIGNILKKKTCWKREIYWSETKNIL